jgi:hypothetical protein
MGKLGKDHGSEYHFRWFRKNRAAELNAKILAALQLPAASLSWIYPNGNEDQKEPRGMSFFRNQPERDLVFRKWKRFWAQTGNPPNWDGIALLQDETRREWILIEAKANHQEFCSLPCGAKDIGRKTIERALGRTKMFLGVHRHFTWLGTYYQYANRLACVYFLNYIARVPSRLLFIYFTGDRFPDEGVICPTNELEWRDLIHASHLTLGLKEKHALSERVHDLFLPVPVQAN